MSFEQQQLADRVCERPWARGGGAQGRVDGKRKGWPDAKFEGTSAKWDLGNEQQREKREESREREERRGKRAERDERRETGGERREKREERREKREERREKRSQKRPPEIPK